MIEYVLLYRNLFQDDLFWMAHNGSPKDRTSYAPLSGLNKNVLHIYCGCERWFRYAWLNEEAVPLKNLDSIQIIDFQFAG